MFYLYIVMLLSYKYFTCFLLICIYLCRMKEGKKVLSIQTDQSVIDKLKEIAQKEKRSQAKTLEVIIEEKYKLLKEDEK